MASKINLTGNEKKVIEFLAQNSRISDSDIASKLMLSSSSVARIRERLAAKGIIKKYSLDIDYDALGISCYVVAFYGATDKWWTNVDELNVFKIASSNYIISMFRTNEKQLSYIILYGFSTNRAANIYFNEIQRVYAEYLIIEKLIFLSKENILKNDPTSLLNILSTRPEDTKPNKKLFSQITKK